MSNLPKITFQDKEDSWSLGKSSKYTLTAGNVNEIKEVVNSLSDEIGNGISFADVYAQLRLIVPSTVEEGKNYRLEIEVSSVKDFSDNVVRLSFPENRDLFKVASAEGWQTIPAEIEAIDASFNGKLLKVDIKELIDGLGLMYFGRMKLVDLADNSSSAWTLFCLGSLCILGFGEKKLRKCWLETSSRRKRLSSRVKHNCSIEAVW